MKRFEARFAGYCQTCRRKFPAGTPILWGQSEGSQHDGPCPKCSDCNAQFGHDEQCPQNDRPKTPVYHTRSYFASHSVEMPANANWKSDKFADETEMKLSEIETGRHGSYFAVPVDPTQDGQFDGYWFARITNISDKDSKWFGHVFVEWVYGDTQKRIGREFPGEGYRSLREFDGRFDYPLNEIWSDPLTAKATYGQRIGKCGHCHKRLTDAVSRERGIGPDCWAALNPKVRLS